MADLSSAINHLLLAKRIKADSQSYKKDNPVEYQKVYLYLTGGPRPTGVTTEMGMGLVEVEDVRRGQTSPPPSDWTTVATEGASFTLTQNKEVRYGKDPTWSASKILGPGTYGCDNATFGDPLTGVAKHCEARDTTHTPPAPSNVAVSAPTGGIT